MLIAYLRTRVRRTSRNIDEANRTGYSQHNLVWTLYKPGEVLYTCPAKTKQPRAVRYVYGNYQSAYSEALPAFLSTYRCIDYSGSTLAEATIEFKIDFFHGMQDVTTLNVYPLGIHTHQASVSGYLLEQERKFISLQGLHHQYYSGFALSVEENRV